MIQVKIANQYYYDSLMAFYPHDAANFKCYFSLSRYFSSSLQPLIIGDHLLAYSRPKAESSTFNRHDITICFDSISWSLHIAPFVNTEDLASSGCLHIANKTSVIIRPTLPTINLTYQTTFR